MYLYSVFMCKSMILINSSEQQCKRSCASAKYRRTRYSLNIVPSRVCIYFHSGFLFECVYVSVSVRWSNFVPVLHCKATHLINLMLSLVIHTQHFCSRCVLFKHSIDLSAEYLHSMCAEHLTICYDR